MVTANYTGRPSNKSQWQPTIPVDQGIYEESSSQKAPLGTRLVVGDRTFYYAQLSTSANVAGGKIVCAPQMIASHQADILTPAVTSAGANVISVTLGTAMATNAYAEGYMIVSSGTGNGMAYRIKSHPAAATAASVAITLYDPVAEPMTATNEVNFVPNMYKAVKVGSEVLDVPVGVVPTAVTTGNYCWLQTHGPASVYASAAWTAGYSLKMGTLGYGAIAITATTAQGATALIIGKNYNLAATAAEECPCLLDIRQ